MRREHRWSQKILSGRHQFEDCFRSGTVKPSGGFEITRAPKGITARIFYRRMNQTQAHANSGNNTKISRKAVRLDRGLSGQRPIGGLVLSFLTRTE